MDLISEMHEPMWPLTYIMKCVNTCHKGEQNTVMLHRGKLP